MTTKTISGEVKENPYGNWSDVDRGWYIGSDNILNLLSEYEGKNVKISIEVVEDSEEKTEVNPEEIDEINWKSLFGAATPDVINRAKELGLI